MGIVCAVFNTAGRFLQHSLQSDDGEYQLQLLACSGRVGSQHLDKISLKTELLGELFVLVCLSFLEALLILKHQLKLF